MFLTFRYAVFVVKLQRLADSLAAGSISTMVSK